MCACMTGVHLPLLAAMAQAMVYTLRHISSHTVIRTAVHGSASTWEPCGDAKSAAAALDASASLAGERLCRMARLVWLILLKGVSCTLWVGRRVRRLGDTTGEGGQMVRSVSVRCLQARMGAPSDNRPVSRKTAVSGRQAGRDAGTSMHPHAREAREWEAESCSVKVCLFSK